MVAVAFKVAFRKVAGAAARPAASPVPHPARLLALAHATDAEIHAGRIRDLADAARLAQVTRARMTQIMNLLLLAPEIQDVILHATGDDVPGERELRGITRLTLWSEQLAAWRTREEKRCPA